MSKSKATIPTPPGFTEGQAIGNREFGKPQRTASLNAPSATKRSLRSATRKQSGHIAQAVPVIPPGKSR